MSESHIHQRVFDWKRQVLPIAIGMFIGVANGILIHEIPTANLQTGIVGYLAIVVTAVAVHELGHVLGAALAGFRILSFAIGPIAVRRESNGLRLRRSDFSLGGAVTAVPVGSHNLRRRMLVLISAGPASSLASGGISFILGSFSTTAFGLNGRHPGESRLLRWAF